MRKVGILLTSVLLMLIALPAFAGGGHDNEEQEKVTICHRTNADENPYVVLTVDSNAVDGIAGNSGQTPDHFGEHVGPVWEPGLKDAKIEWGDIIPPLEGVHDGLNWTEAGQAIYNNDCQPAVPPPPPVEFSQSFDAVCPEGSARLTGTVTSSEEGFAIVRADGNVVAQGAVGPDAPFNFDVPWPSPGNAVSVVGGVDYGDGQSWTGEAVKVEYPCEDTTTTTMPEKPTTTAPPPPPEKPTTTTAPPSVSPTTAPPAPSTTGAPAPSTTAAPAPDGDVGNPLPWAIPAGIALTLVALLGLALRGRTE